ncbi:MAG TPA: Ku protein [Blastocatellia bacterium]|nr:Ku protein [Blastocatellia bacterium]
MKSIWKGHIRFSLVTIPVRVYNAVDTAQTIRMNQLHKDCNGPVGYDKRCKKCSAVLSNEEIVKGYQYEPDQYVIIEPGDFEKVKLKTTRIIEVEGFINAAEIPPTLYESPYFAGPDGEVAGKAYSLLHDALKDSGKLGIGKIVLRDREDVVALAPLDGGLVMYKLRFPAELRSIKNVPQLGDHQMADPEQLKLARSLVETMTTSVDKIEFKDRYNDALRDVINAKVAGKEIVTYVEEEQPVMDIMTALKQSIEQAKAHRKPMVKATGAGKSDAEKKTATVEAVAEARPVKTRKRKAG